MFYEIFDPLIKHMDKSIEQFKKEIELIDIEIQDTQNLNKESNQ